MRPASNGPPHGGINPDVSTWWRRRVATLIKQRRKKDAASLYLEFCSHESRAVELSAHPHR